MIDGKGAQVCECRLKEIRARQLSAIPEEFADIELSRLTADPSRHPKQAAILDALRKDPNGNFVFSGRFGSGKSMFMWALYRHALENTRNRVIVCTLAELLTEYRNFIQASKAGDDPVWPRLQAADLRQKGIKYTVFLDDIDKARPTEYLAEITFEICDAINTYRHQIVATTNLSISKLRDHFNRADERFGGAIVRRLVDNSQIVEMF